MKFQVLTINIIKLIVTWELKCTVWIYSTSITQVATAVAGYGTPTLLIVKRREALSPGYTI